MELRHHREKAGLSLEKVGAVLGWSANTMSRLERGLRPDTTTDEVSAILAAIGVTGADRDRTMRMARGELEGWWEKTNADLSDQARTYLAFERRASRVIDVEPLLVPGLLQTAEYTHAVLIALEVNRSQIPGRIARRMGRQELLVRPHPPELVFVVTELSLRQPVGGHGVMARQLRHMADQAEQPHVSIRVIPKSVVTHPALQGAFVVLEFADEAPVVLIEGRRSAIFPDDPVEVGEYKLAAERSTDLALGGQESQELLRAIAEDMEEAG
jgi:transcriptional regulator with XRE-family HTH domain